MSKDQLSWDQLFQNADSKAAPAPENPSVPTPAEPSAPPTEAPPEKKSPKKRAVKAKSESPEGESAVQYAKKDWSKLEFSSPKPARAAVPEPKSTPAPVIEDESEELFPEEPAAEPQVMTVSELNKHIRDILEGTFPIVWLKGEISNFKAHTSGHFYFSLKDSKAQINAVMFRGFNSQLRFRPEDGMEVLIRGKITVYEPRGNYQIFCEVMEPVGAGALQKAFEQLKAKLQKEGLFDEARKRPIPALPKHIAIVTSPTGAAIRDMLNVLRRRFKGANITVIPCKVQGDQAPGEIIQAIQLANRLSDVDVMIVGRGGGSIEDLWAFNDEGVARAIASARVPVISAVGHEIDFTIADFVADLRAPTPSAAAELVVKNAADLMERVANLQRALRFSVLRQLNALRQSAIGFGKRLVDPQRRIQDASIRCDELQQRLEFATLRSIQDRRLQVELLQQKLGTPLARIERDRGEVQGLGMRLRAAVKNLLLHKRENLGKNMALLDSLSPLKVLDRGYSMVVVDGEIVTEAESLEVGQTVTVRMCKGSVEAKVTKIETKKR
jgi:exodeoxyribonuclease VII large subunit